MQASIVKALMPITTTVPVTLIVFSEIDPHKTETTRTVPPLRVLPEVLTVTKTAYQPKPRLVTVKARSLLKRARTGQKRRNSLLKPVVTTQNKTSLLKPVIAPQDKSLVNPVITSQNKKSLLKPVIETKSQDHINSAEKPLKMLLDVTKSLNNGPLGNFENVPTRVVRTVRPAKSLLKPAMPLNGNPTTSRGTLEEHDYVIKRCSDPPDGTRKATKEVVAGDITLDGFKTFQRAKRSLTVLKNTLKRSKETLHSRHRRVASSVGKVTELKKLLIGLKSRNLITEEAHSKLDKAVNRTLTVLKNNFQTDPTA